MLSPASGRAIVRSATPSVPKKRELAGRSIEPGPMLLSVPPGKAGIPPKEMSFLSGEAVFHLDIHADARHVPLPDNCVDLVVTSPPYWKKRDYGFDGQIGQEPTPQGYVDNIMKALKEWQRLLTPYGSIFLNIGDTYNNKSLAAVPGRVEAAASDSGWIVRNRIIWSKEGGMPEPAINRLANRHEYIIHLVSTEHYYYDIFGYAERFGNGANPGDVWSIPLRRNMGGHLAPFPNELVERAITLGCPFEVCTSCGKPRRRIVDRTAELDPARPQARRAMQLAKEKGLTAAHIAAIQATGISDAGKALLVQTGTGKNSAAVRRLALEAKEALGGYFREFTFARKRTVGWTECDCGSPYRPGIVLDPFQGTGTTARVAAFLGRSSVGVDFAPSANRGSWLEDRAHVRSKPAAGKRRNEGSSKGSPAPAPQAQDSSFFRGLPLHLENSGGD